MRACLDQRELRSSASSNWSTRAVVRRGAGLVSNGIKGRYDRFLDRGPKCRVTLSPAAEQWIAEHCRRGNRQLDARCGGQLARYGYVV